MTRWEYILGVALDQLEQDSTALDVARETLRQLRGVAAVRVEELDGAAFDAQALVRVSDASDLLLSVFRDDHTIVCTMVAVEQIAGRPLWIARGVISAGPIVGTGDVGLSLNATGVCLGTGLAQTLEVYDDTGELFMLLPLNDPRLVRPEDILTFGDPILHDGVPIRPQPGAP